MDQCESIFLPVTILALCCSLYHKVCRGQMSGNSLVKMIVENYDFIFRQTLSHLEAVVQQVTA